MGEQKDPEVMLGLGTLQALSLKLSWSIMGSVSQLSRNGLRKSGSLVSTCLGLYKAWPPFGEVFGGHRSCVLIYKRKLADISLTIDASDETTYTRPRYLELCPRP